jgi:hypothetical protein
MSRQIEAQVPPAHESVHVEVRRRVGALYNAPPFDDVYRAEGELLAWHDVLALARPPEMPGWLSRLKAALKVRLARALHWLFQRQVKFNRVVALHACESARVAAALDGNVLELFTTLKSLQGEVDRLTEQQRRSAARVAELEANLAVMRLRLDRTNTPPVQSSTPPVRSTAAADRLDDFALQNRLLGPREGVVSRLRAYLEYFRDAGKVLDLFCGRGELVELLESEGFPARGVDADADMADYCRDRGLPVDHADAAACLDEQVDASLGGVFLGRAVERLAPTELVDLLRRCRTKLRTGGVVIVEAVNPGCPEAMIEFSVDPERIRPLPPELLRFLFDSAGLSAIDTIVSGPLAADLPAVARARQELPPRSDEYTTYALVGRT